MHLHPSVPALLVLALASLGLTGCAPTATLPPTCVDLHTAPYVAVDTFQDAWVRLGGQRGADFQALFGFDPRYSIPAPPSAPPEPTIITASAVTLGTLEPLATQDDRIRVPVIPAGKFPFGESARVILNANNGDVFVESDYSYFWGLSPYGSSSRGSASSEGTIILIQTEVTLSSGAVVDRYYLLDGASMQVKNASGSQIVTLDTPDTFVQIDDDGTISSIQPIPAKGEICDFVASVIQAAKDAGAKVPPQWE